MAEYAGMRLLDIWYDKITAEDIRARFEAGVAQLQGAAAIRAAPKSIDAIFAKARRKDRLRATDELTTRVDGEWRIVDDPPVVTHIEIPGGGATPGQDVPRLPRLDGREPARADRALPVRGLRAQGRRRRQRRDALLHRPPGGPRRGRPVDPPGQGGDASVLEPHVAASTTRTTASASSSASG